MKRIFLLLAIIVAFSSTPAMAGFAKSNYQGSTIVSLPYYAKTSKPASGVKQGVIILSTGLDKNDCGHGTVGNSNVFTVCFSDGTNWIAI